MLKRVIILIVVLIVFYLLISCGPSTTEETIPPAKFKSSDEVCIMKTFTGVVTMVIEIGKERYYRVDYLTKYGTKSDNYYEYQLTAGSCNTTIEPELIPEDTASSEEDFILN